MKAKATSLVGLDVHARQTHAAVLDLRSGELAVRRLVGVPEEVAAFLDRLPGPIVAVYEAGPTGFGLAREAHRRGIDVRVIAPGSIPKGSGDRVKTDRRDAIRLVRLFAAGELRFVFVPTVEDEAFRDLVRCIEDVRGDLMRARHRLSKFLLRRAQRYTEGSSWSVKHLRWLHALGFDDACSQVAFADYLASVDLLSGRRATLLGALEQQAVECSHAPVIARLRCFRGIETLSAAGVCAEVGSFARFPRPTLLSGFLGIVPTERTSDLKRRQGSITKAVPGTPAGCWSRPPTTTATVPRSVRHSLAAKQARTRGSSRSPGARSAACTSAGSGCTPSDTSPPAWSRSLSPASSPRFFGRPQHLTDTTPIIAPGTLPGRARATRRPTTVAQDSRPDYGQPATHRSRPTLDSEPRRIPGLEVAALEYQSDPAVDRLDLQHAPPRQPPGNADTNPTHRRPTHKVIHKTPYQSGGCELRPTVLAELLSQPVGDLHKSWRPCITGPGPVEPAPEPVPTAGPNAASAFPVPVPAMPSFAAQQVDHLLPSARPDPWLVNPPGRCRATRLG